MGELLIIGPTRDLSLGTAPSPDPHVRGTHATREHFRTCVAGQTCSIDGIRGWHLSDGDSVMVLETCGTADAVDAKWEAYIPRFPNAGVAVEVMRSGATFAFGETPVTALGGQYRICWCAGGFDCTTTEGHRVDVGGLRLVGPSPIAEQHRTCVAGQTCAFDGLTGQDLGGEGGSDAIWVLDTCGVRASTTWANCNSAEAVECRETCAHCIPCIGLEARAPGWTTHECGACNRCDACAVYAPCTPGLNQARTGTGTRTSPWIRCDATRCDGADLEPWGEQRQEALWVGYESHGPTAMLQRWPNSAQRTAVTHTGTAFHWMSEFITAPGGTYRLCWCADSFTCSTPEHFRVDWGALTLVGPSPIETQDRTCVSGHSCSVDGLHGIHVSSADRVVLLDTCGALGAPERFAESGKVTDVVVAGSGGNTFPETTGGAPGVMAPPGASVRLSFGSAQVTATGGQYRLCWCAAGFRCSAAEDFRVTWGHLTLIGPREVGDVRRTCVAGRTCEFQSLLGVHVSD
jgi:hypothetical protein